MIIEIIILSAFSLFILVLKNNKFDISKINAEIMGYRILIIAAAIEITAVFLSKKFEDIKVLNVLSMSWLIYIPILVISLLNIKKHYMKLLFIGTSLNFIAIIFNDFKMPVLISEAYANGQNTKLFLETGKDLIHQVMTDSTRFKCLCDIITLPPPYPFAKTISIGDVFLLAGIFVFWQEVFRRAEGNIN